ncbi:hypothetical protein EWB00_006674 [Schistosoma japonicum]|uniref:Uncharacterized protein n=1 Tax=Schistosoma japonicum TaxID=6182 RepID=A0A4Z2CYF9_SCHJA|nr:hypothetical protein EWB00_006674 [Schistosoma japonicum]
MTSIESSIKETIQRILISSGEPLSTSDLVVDLIYDYIRMNANEIRSQLSTRLPELRDLLIICRNQPFRLIRIVKYYRTMCNSSFFKTIGLTVNINEQFSNWLRLHKLFNQLSIPSPNNVNFWQTFNSCLNQMYCKLNKGRLLRLSRIDSKLANESIDEFLSFNRLRQSASFINLTRSRNYQKFLYWFHDCLILLAYLLNGDVLDIIDMVLFNRQKLHINLSSPITPIEIKQVLCIFTNVLYPRKSTLLSL